MTIQQPRRFEEYFADEVYHELYVSVALQTDRKITAEEVNYETIVAAIKEETERANGLLECRVQQEKQIEEMKEEVARRRYLHEQLRARSEELRKLQHVVMNNSQRLAKMRARPRYSRRASLRDSFQVDCDPPRVQSCASALPAGSSLALSGEPCACPEAAEEPPEPPCAKLKSPLQ